MTTEITNSGARTQCVLTLAQEANLRCKIRLLVEKRFRYSRSERELFKDENSGSEFQILRLCIIGIAIKFIVR